MRLGSKRLPKKALLRILGKTMVELLVERLQRVRNAKVILVTGDKEKNQELIQEAERLSIPYFCGSEENLLDRFYQASQVHKPDVIVRVTGDNILVDPALVEKAIERFMQDDCDVLFMQKGYPIGVGVDIFSRVALEKAWQAAHGELANSAEAITMLPDIRRVDMAHEKDYSHMRLTVDYEEDFQLAKKIYEALYPLDPNFSLEDVIRFLQQDMV